jgi:pterin-4a-carbinolamine dehydratase
MTDEQINIAIAEACGWRLIFKTKIRQYGRPPWKIDGCRKRIPDFCNDLNAMNEAEKVLDYEQSEVFSDKVADIVQAVNHEMDYPFPWHFARIHATARQRAEAFLRTLGKWEESK